MAVTLPGSLISLMLAPGLGLRCGLLVLRCGGGGLRRRRRGRLILGRGLRGLLGLLPGVGVRLADAEGGAGGAVERAAGGGGCAAPAVDAQAQRGAGSE